MAKMRLLASLLALVFFLFMVNPCVGASGREMFVVFKGDQTEVSFKEDGGTITKRIPRAFRVPAFVGGIVNDKEFLVLLCDAHYNSLLNGNFIEAAARTSYGNYKTWSDAEIVFKNSGKNKKHSVLGDLTAVMKDNKIFVLASSLDVSNTAWVNQNGDTGWDPLMFIGTVMDNTDPGSPGVCVKWDNGTSLKSLLSSTTLGKNGIQFIGGIGNGVVTKSGTIIFPVQIAHSYYSECAASIVYSTDDGSTWKIGGSIHYDPTEGSVTEWGNGKLLLDLRYDHGFRLIYESNDMGTTWKESTMFNRVWGNQQNRQGVGSQGSLITVPVDGKDVLLFSHPLNKKGGINRDTLQLWMSDGQRIVCVGTISEDGKGERSGHSILAHVRDHLYAVHEINPHEAGSNDNAPLEKWDRVIALSSIPDLFESVKSTARVWRQVDKELNDISVPTNGLVGFLADNKNNTVWEDKYDCVHANVNGATRVEGGFRFDGTPGSGAQWPVQSQGQNQLYIFTSRIFTLAATVTIHSTREAGDHLLLGASKDAAGTKVLIGIGYTQDKKWYAADSNGVIMTTGASFELEKEYHVAITFIGKVSVYVDGVPIINRKNTYYGYSLINHFFMGGVGKSSTAKSSLCTVKNVMLFNRVLGEAEFTKIKNVDKYVKQKESTSKMDTKETSDPGSRKIPIGDGDDRSEKSGPTARTRSTENPTSVNKSHDGGSKKGHKRADVAVWSVSVAAWMCLVCSAIALAGF